MKTALIVSAGLVALGGAALYAVSQGYHLYLFPDGDVTVDAHLETSKSGTDVHFTKDIHVEGDLYKDEDELTYEAAPVEDTEDEF